MMKELKRRIRNILMILLSAVFAGTLLLMLVFALPVDSARAHVEESLYDMIEVREDEDGDSLRKQIVALKENFTDTLMVQNALEKVEDKSLIQHAMYIYHYDHQADDSTWLTEESLITFLREGDDSLHLREYSKYWHGYLVFLKPLLMLMSWKSAETFLVVFQTALLLAIVIVACVKRNAFLGAGVVTAFVFMKPLRVEYSLAMCVCWLITMTALLLLALFYEKIELKNWREELFLLIGIATAYMDFLTYPIVTLGLPLCFYLVRDMDKELSLWKRLKQAFWICACWCVGYIGMWGMKWVVAELTCQTGTLRNAVWSVIYRTGPLDGYGSAFTGVSRTIDAVLGQYEHPGYTIAFVVIAAVTVLSVLLCLMKARNKNWAATIGCLAVVALFPFVWLILTQNHTAIHCVFTFRIMSVSVMALWCMAVCSVRTLWRKVRAHAENE